MDDLLFGDLGGKSLLQAGDVRCPPPKGLPPEVAADWRVGAKGCEEWLKSDPMMSRFCAGELADVLWERYLAIFYSLLESAKLVGLEPKAYLRQAALTALAGQRVPLAHQVAADQAKPN